MTRTETEQTRKTLEDVAPGQRGIILQVGNENGPVKRRLVDMGLTVEKPEGAFYMFVDIRKFGMDSNTFCTRMLKEGLVGVIPGIHFGTEGFMRLSYCYSDADLKEGLDRIEKFIKSL